VLQPTKALESMNGKVTIHSQEWLSQGFLKLARITVSHSSFAGGMLGPMTRELVLRPPAVAVLPYDPVTDKVLLIEQFRVAAHLSGLPPWEREVVAGIGDKDETPEQLACREAMEEANCPLTDLIEMHRYLPSPGVTNEVVIGFCGRMDSRNLGVGVHGLEEEHENIRSTLFDVAEIPGILDNPQTCNGPLIMALQWLLLNRDRLRAAWR
jgi:ADP-ribose pyrophosphatase